MPTLLAPMSDPFAILCPRCGANGPIETPNGDGMLILDCEKCDHVWKEWEPDEYDDLDDDDSPLFDSSARHRTRFREYDD